MVEPLNTTATINTGTGANSTKPNAYYDKLLLKLLVQTDFYHSRFAQRRPMPRNYGDTINFRKIVKLEPNLTPLVEGVTPEGDEAKLEAISATTQQYGKWLGFSDRVDFQMVDPIVKEYVVELGRVMRETLDLLVRNELTNGSNVFYAGGKTSRSALGVGDIPTIDDFRKIRLSLIKNHVPPAVQGKYVAFISPEVAFNLMDDEKFMKAYEIAQNGQPFIKGEIADVYGIKFIEVPNARVEGDVHLSVVIGGQVYGITEIRGEGDVQTIIKPLGSAGTEDPLNQRQTIGAKVNAFVAKRLYEEGIVRYESVPNV